MSWLVWIIAGVAVYLIVGAGVARLRYHLIDTGRLWQMIQVIEKLWEGDYYHYPTIRQRDAAQNRNASWAAWWPLTLVWEAICLLAIVVWIGYDLFLIALEFVWRPLCTFLDFVWRHVFMTADQR